jgi:hypothetical protein
MVSTAACETSVILLLVGVAGLRWWIGTDQRQMSADDSPSSNPELQRHIRRQVIGGKGYQRARNHSEEAADKQSYEGKDQHNQDHRDGKELMLIIERPSLDIREGLGKGHDERGSHMNTIDLLQDNCSLGLPP